MISPKIAELIAPTCQPSGLVARHPYEQKASAERTGGSRQPGVWYDPGSGTTPCCGHAVADAVASQSLGRDRAGGTACQSECRLRLLLYLLISGYLISSSGPPRPCPGLPLASFRTATGPWSDSLCCPPEVTGPSPCLVAPGRAQARL